MDREKVIESTRQWLSAVVIGLNLCPFARRVFETGRIRYSVTDAGDQKGLLRALNDELTALESSSLDEIETTILIHPNVLKDFLDYNDFLDRAEALLDERDLTGVVQIASFHPDYQFAGTAVEDVENYTNRSPYPMLHLLREDSVTAATESYDGVDEIPERNIETMRQLGREQILAMLRATRPE